MESGETPEQAAIREVREEISVEIELIGKAGERSVTGAERRYDIAVFAAKLLSGEPQTGPEASEVGWFEIEQIQKLDATPELFAYALKAKNLFFGVQG